VDVFSHTGIKKSHAWWDEISVAPYMADVVAAEAAGMDSDVPVANVEPQVVEDDMVVPNRVWEKVDTKGSSPPPRYSHSSVVYGDKMYVFGGERSAFAFGDIWAYDFKEATWEFVTPNQTTVAYPAARYDHSAAVSEDGHMIVYGGRNGNQYFGDMWAFDLETKVWYKMADITAAGSRFGHSAAIAPGSSEMFIFGGYTDTGFTDTFFKCEGGECLDITLGCPEAPGQATVRTVGLTPRYSQTSFADERFVYVYGGSNMASKEGFTDLFKFAIEECSWEKLLVGGDEVGRYEHTAGLISGGMYVHGGHFKGSYLEDTYFFPL